VSGEPLSSPPYSPLAMMRHCSCDAGSAFPLTINCCECPLRAPGPGMWVVGEQTFLSP
jgi:hypothetical protein